MSSGPSPVRVNSSLLPRFVGKDVRLICKPINFSGTGAVVAASDGGQVSVTLTSDSNLGPNEYYEVLGKVVDKTTVRMFRYTSMGNDLDMKLVNDTIELMHDPRFYSTFFSPE